MRARSTAHDRSRGRDGQDHWRVGLRPSAGQAQGVACACFSIRTPSGSHVDHAVHENINVPWHLVGICDVHAHADGEACHLRTGQPEWRAGLPHEVDVVEVELAIVQPCRGHLPLGACQVARARCVCGHDSTASAHSTSCSGLPAPNPSRSRLAASMCSRSTSSAAARRHRSRRRRSMASVRSY